MSAEAAGAANALNVDPTADHNPNRLTWGDGAVLGGLALGNALVFTGIATNQRAVVFAGLGETLASAMGGMWRLSRGQPSHTESGSGPVEAEFDAAPADPDTPEI